MWAINSALFLSESLGDRGNVLNLIQLNSTLRTDLGGCGPSLGGYSPVIQEGLVVGVGLNQSWLQVEHGGK